MFHWFKSNNKCNRNGKLIVIVIGFLNVSSNSNSNRLFKCDVIVILIGYLNI